MLSRFPAAKTVRNTSTQEVLPSLDDIYTSYGYPNTHLTDNGPPFNSEGFKNYSLQKGIQHQRTYPYHPQANPAERIMKPIGKAMKAAFMEGANQQQALNQFLATYRATPHIATGVPPGDFLLRDGYRVDFPARKPLNARDIAQAKHADAGNKEAIQKKANLSVKRRREDISVGDTVLLKNQKRASKFDPKFDPNPCQVKESSKRGLILVRQSDKAIFRRHKDDVKPFGTSTEARKLANGHHKQGANSFMPEENGDNFSPSETLEAPNNNATNVPEILHNLPVTSGNEAIIPQSGVTKTRSGRVTKPPNWFSDYQRF